MQTKVITTPTTLGAGGFACSSLLTLPAASSARRARSTYTAPDADAFTSIFTLTLALAVLIPSTLCIRAARIVSATLTRALPTILTVTGE